MARKSSPEDGGSWLPLSLRMALYARGGFCCTYCGKSSEKARITLDHVQSRKYGGSDDPSNLVTACNGCNARKRDMGLSTWCTHLTDDLRWPVAKVQAMRIRVLHQTAAHVDEGLGFELARNRRANEPANR